MATKFLDYTGLSYLWGKIKAWCNSIFVTKATDEDITGTKTFLGSKKIAFKQSGANDKLGFTLYNNSSKEQGYLEYNPTNKIANVPLFTLGNYATAANELSYIGFRRYSSISGASGAYNLLAPLVSDAKTPFSLTTTYTNFYLPLGISNGTSIVTASNSGVIDISSFLTLTGYTKPSTGSALATTDTISEALGKLEVKVDAVDDSNYVHLTGNETIAGEKKFTDLVRLEQNGPQIYYKDLSITRGTTPQNILYRNWIHVADSAGNSITRFYGVINSDSATTTQIYTYPITNTSSDDFALFRLGYDGSGTKFMSGPSTSENRSNGGDVVTRDWIPKDTRVVHTSGNETIDGTKSFIGDFPVRVSDSTSSGVILRNTNTVRGAVDANSNHYTTIVFADANGDDWASDSASHGRMGVVEAAYDTTGGTFINIAAYKNEANSSDVAKATLWHRADGRRDFVMNSGSFCDKVNAIRGTAPSSNQYFTPLKMYDGTSEKLFFSVYGQYMTDQTNYACLLVYKGTDNSNTYSRLLIGYNSNGDVYTSAPTPAVSSNDNNIATTKFVKDQNYLPKSGGTMTGALAFSIKNNFIQIYSPGITKGTAPTGTSYAYAEFFDQSNNRMGWIGHVYYTDKTNVIRLCARKAVNSSDTTETNLSIGYDGNGNFYSAIGTPADSSNNENIANTLWVRRYCEVTKSFVTTNTEQTISQNKIFTAAPYIQNADFNFKNTGFTRPTLPSSTKGGSIYLKDNANNIQVAIQELVDTSGTVFAMATVYEYVNSPSGKSVGITFPKAGTPVFRPFSDNDVQLGAASRRWKQLYAGTTTINTSDERYKQNIVSVPDDVLDAWENVSFYQFKMRDAVIEKGSKARLHNGLIAQRIEEAFISKGLDASDYGLFCYDSWEYKDALVNNEGNIIEDEIPADNIYSLRYEEALCMEAAYQRRKNKILENRISELERQVSDMLQILQSLKGAN